MSINDKKIQFQKKEKSLKPGIIPQKIALISGRYFFVRRTTDYESETSLSYDALYVHFSFMDQYSCKISNIVTSESGYIMYKNSLIKVDQLLSIGKTIASTGYK